MSDRKQYLNGIDMAKDTLGMNLPEPIEEVNSQHDMSINHPFMSEFRQAIDSALIAAVGQSEMNNEVSVTAQIKFSLYDSNPRTGVKQFGPAEHKVAIKVKRESLQMTGISHSFVANRIDGRYILTDPEDDQITIADIAK